MHIKLYITAFRDTIFSFYLPAVLITATTGDEWRSLSFHEAPFEAKLQGASKVKSRTPHYRAVEELPRDFQQKQ